MDNTESLRQLFDQYPYPINKIEMSPREDTNFLFLHSLTTAQYLRGNGYIPSNGKVILDVGCGSGYAALAMAIANPEAKIVGIDLSPKSVAVARERMQFHGFTNCEFHAISVEELPSLGMKFDYINCDETLYLLLNPTEGLQIMASVLSRQGVIRTNLHSRYSREEFFRAQTLSRFLGLMDGEIGDWECEVINELMESLKNGVKVKTSWQSLGNRNEEVRMNFLLPSDKGYTIPEMFTMLESSDLELISMVNWRQWRLEDLFQSADSLPEYLELMLGEATPMQRLHLYELLHPVHRLLDFWCGHQNTEPSNHHSLDFAEITYSDVEAWQNYTIYLHPQLHTDKFKQALEEAISKSLPFPITQFLNCTSSQSLNLFAPANICLWLLWQHPQSIAEIIKYWMTIKPLNSLNLQPTNESEAFLEIHQTLLQLESLLIVLIAT